jgi:hypothetical protein
MIAKHMAAAAAALCLVWGAAYAGPENVQGSPDIPEGVGATNDVVILELGPMQEGAGAADMAAMQMLLLQLLMMQSEPGAGGGEVLLVPTAPAGLEI